MMILVIKKMSATDRDPQTSVHHITGEVLQNSISSFKLSTAGKE